MKTLSPTTRWQKAWAVLMPHIAVPSDTDAANWLRFPQVYVDRAILRCSRRYALDKITEGFTPADAYRYVWLIANEATKTERKRLLTKLQFGKDSTTTATADEADDNIGNRA